ncbi:glutaminyl-peptide cyclotransferase-like a [Hippocampus comes]|uniref:Glutaminyl-peptide cyclotransferase n=1 Tax=Hippocampus comes TaxID=109280 RepID=A0A3Q2XYV3_HIPCM|nr:PREDICTED: glutaminyl-peptide cyclotransferase-like protein [Hippocampus comes]
MSKSSRRQMPPRQSNDCDRLKRLCLLGLLVAALVLALYLINVPNAKRVQVADLNKDKWFHKPTKYTASQIHQLASQVDGSRLWEVHLRPILIKRLPGTQESKFVRQHITATLSALSANWDVNLDPFSAATPKGQVTFTNVIAILDPLAPRRLLLACHYDTKALPPDNRAPQRDFVGATDSAVPCAMILELATALDNKLKSFKKKKPPVTLQLVFFDGEESFGKWTATDSLYGSRHLAERMAATSHPAGAVSTTQIQAVDLFVLLDLLGSPNPLIVNHFENTAHWFAHLIATEKRLHRQGLLASHPSEQTYFRKDLTFGLVEDDHIPFLRRGVPVLHVIATPFPNVWHTLDDTEENLHRPTVENLTKIMAVFLAEYLGL